MNDICGVEMAKRINQRRKQLNLSIEELAGLVGMSTTSISNYVTETADTNTAARMKVQTLYKFAKALGVPTDWLIGLVESSDIVGDEATLKKRYGLSNVAITNLNNLPHFKVNDDITSEYLDNLAASGLDEYSYLNAVIESKYLIYFIKCISAYSRLNYESDRLRYEIASKIKESKTMTRNTIPEHSKIIESLNKKNKEINLLIRSEKLFFNEHTENLFDDVSSKVNRKLRALNKENDKKLSEVDRGEK